MLLVRAGPAMREENLHAEIPVTVLVQLLKHAHGEVALCWRVQRRVEVPVERTPARGLSGAQRVLELVEDLGRALQLLGAHLRDGAAQQVALDFSAKFEQFVDFVERQARNDRSAVRVERDESLGLELAKRFANRDAADAELVGEGVLAQRLAFG